MPLTRTSAPELTVPTLRGTTWSLSAQAPTNFTYVTFYRGLHCPICSKYLKALNEALPEFEKRGVGVVAVSMDTAERARESAEGWGVSALEIGYGLPLEMASEWGLMFSAAVKESEPAVFSEPGHFFVRPSGELYFASVQSAPFTRPAVAELLGALDFVVPNAYPARGELSVEAARAAL